MLHSTYAGEMLSSSVHEKDVELDPCGGSFASLPKREMSRLTRAGEMLCPSEHEEDFKLDPCKGCFASLPTRGDDAVDPCRGDAFSQRA